MSKYYLSHVFSEKMGMSFPEYLQSIRLNCAVSLIAGGEQSITEIAADSGFESQRTLFTALSAPGSALPPCNTGNGFCSPAGRPRKNFMPSEGKPSFRPQSASTPAVTSGKSGNRRLPKGIPPKGQPARAVEQEAVQRLPQRKGAHADYGKPRKTPCPAALPASAFE